MKGRSVGSHLRFQNERLLFLQTHFHLLGKTFVDVPPFQQTEKDGVTGGGPDDPFVATACASWMAAATRQAP